MKCQNTIVSAMGGDAASIAAINQGILMACFELDHAPNSLGAEELKRLGVKDMDNDHLRLCLGYDLSALSPLIQTPVISSSLSVSAVTFWLRTNTRRTMELLPKKWVAWPA